MINRLVITTTLIVLFSCNVRVFTSFKYQNQDLKNTKATRVYYNILFDSTGFDSQYLSFISRGKSFLSFNEKINNEINKYKDSLSVAIPVLFDSSFILGKNVIIEPEPKQRMATENTIAWWSVLYPKQINNIAVNGLRLFSESTYILNFYHIKIDEGNMFATVPDVNGQFRLDICLIEKNRVVKYKRMAISTYRNQLAALRKKGNDNIEWFQDKHIKAIVREAFKEIKE